MVKTKARSDQWRKKSSRKCQESESQNIPLLLIHEIELEKEKLVLY